MNLIQVFCKTCNKSIWRNQQDFQRICVICAQSPTTIQEFEKQLKEEMVNQGIYSSEDEDNEFDEVDPYMYTEGLGELDEEWDELWEAWEDIYIPASKKKSTCECSKAKFNFIQHSDWCPKYVKK